MPPECSMCGDHHEGVGCIGDRHRWMEISRGETTWRVRCDCESMGCTVSAHDGADAMRLARSASLMRTIDERVAEAVENKQRLVDSIMGDYEVELGVEERVTWAMGRRATPKLHRAVRRHHEHRATVQSTFDALIYELYGHANEVLDGTPWHQLWLMLSGTEHREPKFWAAIRQTKQTVKIKAHIREYAKGMVSRGEVY